MKFLRMLAAAAAFSMLYVPAFAHTTIVASNIMDGSEIRTAPDVFEFSFGADVGLAGLELETLSGEAVDIDFQRPGQMRKDFAVPLPMLEPEAYVLKWRAVAKDGHVMRGEIDFTVTG